MLGHLFGRLFGCSFVWLVVDSVVGLIICLVGRWLDRLVAHLFGWSLVRSFVRLVAHLFGWSLVLLVVCLVGRWFGNLVVCWLTLMIRTAKEEERKNHLTT